MAISVRTSQRMSPGAMGSPSFLSHLTMAPSLMEGDNDGIVTWFTAKIHNNTKRKINVNTESLLQPISLQPGNCHMSFSELRASPFSITTTIHLSPLPVQKHTFFGFRGKCEGTLLGSPGPRQPVQCRNWLLDSETESWAPRDESSPRGTVTGSRGLGKPQPGHGLIHICSTEAGCHCQ